MSTFSDMLARLEAKLSDSPIYHSVDVRGSYLTILFLSARLICDLCPNHAPFHTATKRSLLLEDCLRARRAGVTWKGTMWCLKRKVRLYQYAEISESPVLTGDRKG